MKPLGDHTRKRKRSKSSLGARSLKRCSSTTSVSSVSSYISTETCDEVADINAWNIRRALSRTPNSVYSSSCVTDSSTVEYDDVGRLVKKRTRSVSRAQEEEKLRLESVEGTIFYCTEKDCDGSFMDLDLYNLHRTIRHRALAMYICYECNKSYTTAEHLRLHSLTHDISSFFCLMCGVEMPNCAELQKHLDEHLAYSVPCKYCDKSFLSKSACAQHCQVKHKKTRYRRLNRCEHLIIDRVDFKPLSTNDNQEDRTYKAYIIEQGSSTRLDVNPENLRMMNIENTEDDLPSGEVEAEYETKEVEENIAQPEELAEEISQELVEEGVIQEEEIVENGISEESFSELLSSSEMLEDVRENCD
ncbi:unnamed protein product [Acanthoscelides obtectus]|uniref:C2H2-type domain-containing protein n=1 Tax=Acanthoscelides obtectus TaxID=200917 RepID=A0A9P0KMN4_ACAOB|nr:unnamed protein product [Acanthoscelides obtectus]CAK1621026.1 Zinc finger protein 777 [Acanthoscelides obtectus]